MISQTVQQLVASAFREVAIYTPVMPIPPDDLAFGLDKLNRLLDESHNDRRLTYSQQFFTGVLTANHQPHTIGPAANNPDFAVTQRPIELRAGSIVLTDVTPNVFVPLAIERWAWWAEEVPVRAVNTTIPRHVYYQPDWPLASLYLWPVPTLAYTLELVFRSSAFFNGTGAGGTWVLTDTITLPPGYAEWVTCKLAKRLAPAYPGASVPSTLEGTIAELEMKLFNINQDIPELDLVDAGMPGGDHHASGSMNYRSRTLN